jgi:hypothetical protein
MEASDRLQQLPDAHLQNGWICSTREEHPCCKKRRDSSGLPVPSAQSIGSCAPARGEKGGSSRPCQRPPPRTKPEEAVAHEATGRRRRRSRRGAAVGEAGARRQRSSVGMEAVARDGGTSDRHREFQLTRCAVLVVPGEDGEGRSPAAPRSCSASGSTTPCIRLSLPRGRGGGAGGALPRRQPWSSASGPPTPPTAAWPHRPASDPVSTALHRFSRPQRGRRGEMAPLLRLTQIQRLLEVELRPPTVEVGWSSWRPVRKGRAAHRRSGVAAELARRSWRGPREERRERGRGRSLVCSDAQGSQECATGEARLHFADRNAATAGG